MTDRLTEITVTDLPKLRDLYKPEANTKKSYIAFTTIEGYISWFKQKPSLANVKIYCLNDDFSDGTFAVIVSIFISINSFSNYFFCLFRKNCLIPVFFNFVFDLYSIPFDRICELLTLIH